MYKIWRTASVLIFLSLFILVGCNSSDKKRENIVSSSSSTPIPKVEPKLSTKVIVDKLEGPWDIAFLPDKTLIFTESSGKISTLIKGKVSVVANIENIRTDGEGGLLGLAVDSEFKTYRFIYACANVKLKDSFEVQVLRFKLNKKQTKAEKAVAIIKGITSADGGRHSGCRIRTAADGTLFIGTGDAAMAKLPQDKKSLNGKILHVDRNGNAVNGNLGSPFDSRILNYGHRNVQGIALFDKPINGVYGLSVEHGPGKDDEVNLIKRGNFGWAPTGDYDEGVPMTDLKLFPKAIPAIWSSGDPTVAPSGATILSGSKWGSFDGALAVAVLKDKKVKVLKFDSNYKSVLEVDVLTEFGRIRSVVQGPDGNLYVATDDQENGQIIKVTPSLK